MKKLAIGLLIITTIIATVLWTGCPGYSSSAPTPIPQKSTASTEYVNPGVVLPDEPPADRTWISPGKVQVGNFYPGARAEWNITIHNGKDTECSFAVSYRYPDHVGEEYVKPITEAQDWVIIADSTPVLMPRETKDILVVLDMPEESDKYGTLNRTITGDKWEFWTSVIDTSQTGMVQTELCTRWLVSMR